MHRDLKPHNVLLNDSGVNGNALICDLGTAKNMTPGALNFERANNQQHLKKSSDASSPNMTTMTGTPMYMAPEMFKSKTYTSAVDVWSYGVLLVRLFTLKSPYPSSTTSAQLIRKVENNELRPRKVKRSALPHPKIRDVIDGCLKFEASERMTFLDIEMVMSEILGELEGERKGGGGALPQHEQMRTTKSKSNIDMTLTLTQSVGRKSGNTTVMRMPKR